jgi:putative phosphoribosyl transferase
VAAALGLPLDVFVVRKLGAPLQPELAVGAIAPGGVTILDEALIDRLGVSQHEIVDKANAERVELERRESLYRGAGPLPDVDEKLVILVDDGLATGSTMKAAIEAVRRLGASRVVVAVPVAPAQTCLEIDRIADDVVCLSCPEFFRAVGEWYLDFGQVSDAEVRRLLADSRKLRGAKTLALPSGRSEWADDAVDYEDDQECAAEPAQVRERHVKVPGRGAVLDGDLAIPANARGVVLFAHGSGSSRHSPRNKAVARELNEAGYATLLLDLLTRSEEAIDIQTAELRFNIELLAKRLLWATEWVKRQPQLAALPIGYFGASTGAAAALIAAAQRPDDVSAVVSRGGRPDLAMDHLVSVRAPTLLIIGGRDAEVIELNRQAFSKLRCGREMVIVPGAGHLFEDPGALEQVSRLAERWFEQYLIQ